MCSITGAVPLTRSASIDPDEYVSIFGRALERGRDAWGVASAVEAVRSPQPFTGTEAQTLMLTRLVRSAPSWVIGLNRAEPSTEHFAVDPDLDLAPHQMLDSRLIPAGHWTTVHNGIIANDRDLAEHYGIPRGGIDSRVVPYVFNEAEASNPFQIAQLLTNRITGSYALAAGHRDGGLVLACNYKPLFTCVRRDVLYFASLPHHLPDLGIRSTVRKMDPYSVMAINDGVVTSAPIQPRRMSSRHRYLVVLSGGLDSTTVLTGLVREGMDVAALHVHYGCYAESRERTAAREICKRLGVELIELTTDLFSHIGGSALLASEKGTISDGHRGAEYAHEWVPARNLILASIAVAMAESHGFDTIALGNNLEESGIYPDNEQEFIRSLNAVLPNAVQEGRRVQIIEPVGNLMKHEIVARGLRDGAPYDLTWSCYRGGDVQCGRCGSCFLRCNAFRRNGAVDPIPYETEVPLPV